MDLSSAINRAWKKEVIIQSIIWNTIIEIFKSKKNMDITSYLISIKLKWENILVKTSKPIINNELYLYSEEIKKSSLSKLEKIWIKYKDFEIKFL